MSAPCLKTPLLMYIYIIIYIHIFVFQVNFPLVARPQNTSAFRRKTKSVFTAILELHPASETSTMVCTEGATFDKNTSTFFSTTSIFYFYLFFVEVKIRRCPKILLQWRANEELFLGVINSVFHKCTRYFFHSLVIHNGMRLYLPFSE